MANNLQKMFVVVPTGKAAAFKTAHTGSGINSSDAYYDKIAFLQETGEIVTHGVVYALNANLLNGDKDTVGSIKQQIKTVVDTYLSGSNSTQAMDTLAEVITWIQGHQGQDGSAAGYLVEDVKRLMDLVEGTTTYYQTVEEYNTGHASDPGFEQIDETAFNALTAEQKIATVDTASSLAGRVAALEATNTNRDLHGSITVADTNSVVSATIAQDNDGKLTSTGSSLTVATESLHNVVGMTYTNGTWSASQNSTVSNANALAVASDVAAELVADEQVIATALNAHESRLDVLEGTDAEPNSVASKIKAMKETLDADRTSDDNTLVTVQVVEVDGVITDVVVTKQSAGITGTRYVPANGQTPATNPALTVTTTTGGVDGADVVIIKEYIDDKVQQAADNSSSAISNLDVASTTVRNTQNSVDYTAVTYEETDGLVSITGLTNAIGAVSESNDTMVVTTEGLIDAQALATTLNAIDPWFTYEDETPEP